MWPAKMVGGEEGTDDVEDGGEELLVQRIQVADYSAIEGTSGQQHSGCSASTSFSGRRRTGIRLLPEGWKVGWGGRATECAPLTVRRAPAGGAGSVIDRMIP